MRWSCAFLSYSFVVCFVKVDNRCSMSLLKAGCLYISFITPTTLSGSFVRLSAFIHSLYFTVSEAFSRSTNTINVVVAPLLVGSHCSADVMDFLCCAALPSKSMLCALKVSIKHYSDSGLNDGCKYVHRWCIEARWGCNVLNHSYNRSWIQVPR